MPAAWIISCEDSDPLLGPGRLTTEGNASCPSFFVSAHVATDSVDATAAGLIRYSNEITILKIV